MVCMHVVLFVECWLVASSSIYYQIFLASMSSSTSNALPLPFSISVPSLGLFSFSYSAGAGDGALTAIGADPSTPSGSGDSVRSSAACGRGQGNNDSGGRTPPSRRRGAARGLLRASVGGGGGSESSALLGSQERNVRWSRGTSVCCCAGGAGLDRVSASRLRPHSPSLCSCSCHPGEGSRAGRGGGTGRSDAAACPSHLGAGTATQLYALQSRPPRRHPGSRCCCLRDWTTVGVR